MAKGISVSESDRRRVRGAIVAFVEAGKYTRDKEPKSMSWLMGVISTSSLRGDELMEIFQHIGSFPWGAEEKMRLQEVRRKLVGAGKGFIKQPKPKTEFTKIPRSEPVELKKIPKPKTEWKSVPQSAPPEWKNLPKSE